MWRRRVEFLTLTTLLAGFLTFSPNEAVLAADAEEPLHRRVDAMISADRSGPDLNECTDAEFLRRVSLDLNGVIPTAEEARAFIDDPSPEKRTALVDRLLASPRYTRHMTNVLDVMLMERRKDKHVKAPEWRKYLHESIAANKPFDQLATEILSANGADPKLRPAAKFYLDREGEPNLLTRDVGRIFFGRDFQCAQCHNHPLIDDYLQEDYYGIYAFFNRGSLLTDKKAKQTFYVEKAEGEAVFTSVFTEEKSQTRPRLPSGTEIEEPIFGAGEAYQPKPVDKIGRVPKFSRREQLSQSIAGGANDAFNRNFANRFWAHMMGRGLVHPVDLHHPDNPPSHPQLLDLLADELVATKFNLKAFLRELALTRVYRRSFEIPSQVGDAAPAATKIEALAAEHEKLEAAIEPLESEVEAAHEAMLATLEPAFKARAEFDKLAKELEAVQKAAREASGALAKSRKELSTNEQAAALLTEALAKADAVVKQFPKDKEFKAAADTYRSKSQKTTEKIAALQKAIPTQEAAAKAAQEKVIGPQKAADEAKETLAAARKTLHAARTPYFVKLYQLREVQEASRHAYARLESARALDAHEKAVAALSAARESAAQSKTELDKILATLKQTETQLATVQKSLPVAEQDHASAAAAVALANKPFEDKQPLYQQVAAAAEAGQVALSVLPDDVKLQTSTSQLAALAEQLKLELAPLEKTFQQRNEELASAVQRVEELRKQVETSQTAIEQAKQQLPQLEQQLKKLNETVIAKQVDVDSTYQTVAEKLTSRFTAGTLKPLTPEQLSWSMMQVGGLVEKQEIAAAAEIDKKGKLAPVERTKQIEAAVNEKLKGNVGAFVKTFGAGAGQPQNEFFSTVDQALFFTNGGTVRNWLKPGGGNLTDRLQKLADPAAFADELYLAVLTRRPTEAEVSDIREYLTGRTDEEKAAVARELTWALLTSAEFRFGH